MKVILTEKIEHLIDTKKLVKRFTDAWSEHPDILAKFLGIIYAFEHQEFERYFELRENLGEHPTLEYHLAECLPTGMETIAIKGLCGDEKKESFSDDSYVKTTKISIENY